MNTITKDERNRLVSLAKASIQLDATGEIVGGFEPAWRAFQQTHDISDARARAYVSRAARLMRGERIRNAGRPPTMIESGPYTVYLEPRHVGAAARAGSGNVSAGVRLALEYWELQIAREQEL